MIKKKYIVPSTEVQTIIATSHILSASGNLPVGGGGQQTGAHAPKF